MTSQTYFQDMLQLVLNCQHDKDLTPATQLVYRVLVTLYNRHYWAAPFAVSDAELQAITHISSRQDITRVKRRLKNLGYIDFFGKPTQYIIYRPPVQRQVQPQVHSQPPRPPSLTSQLSNQTIPKKKTSKEERQENGHELHNRNQDRPNNSTPNSQDRERLEEEFERRYRQLRRRIESDGDPLC